MNNYRANLDSAIAYLKVGQKGLAFDALKNALTQVPDEDKLPSNPHFLKILILLADILISEAKPIEAGRLIETGLLIKEDCADLLLQKSLLVFDMKDYDETLILVTRFLLGLEQARQEDYECYYDNDIIISELFDNMIPASYRGSKKIDEIYTTVKRFVEKTNYPLLKRFIEKMDELKTQTGI